MKIFFYFNDQPNIYFLFQEKVNPLSKEYLKNTSIEKYNQLSQRYRADLKEEISESYIIKEIRSHIPKISQREFNKAMNRWESGGAQPEFMKGPETLQPSVLLREFFETLGISLDENYPCYFCTILVENKDNLLGAYHLSQNIIYFSASALMEYKELSALDVDERGRENSLQQHELTHFLLAKHFKFKNRPNVSKNKKMSYAKWQEFVAQSISVQSFSKENFIDDYLFEKLPRAYFPFQKFIWQEIESVVRRKYDMKDIPQRKFQRNILSFSKTRWKEVLTEEDVQYIQKRSFEKAQDILKLAQKVE